MIPVPTTEVLAPEIWTSPAGAPAELHYAGFPEVPDDDEFGDCGWYPESPGQLPPRCYELRTPVTGTVVHSLIVFPVAPWSPYDAVSDRLLADGWAPPEPTEDELATCQHGLSAQLCSGPNHY